jgi:hypothetical protein
MYQEEKVSLTIAIPKSYRDRLRTLAAQQNLHDPDQLTSASTIAREIICEHLDGIEYIEAGSQSKDHSADSPAETERIKSSEVEVEKIGSRGD